MSGKEKPTHTMPGGAQDDESQPDDGVVNDSFGTIDTADTTGIGEEDQSCKPRKNSSPRNPPRHENSPRRN